MGGGGAWARQDNRRSSDEAVGRGARQSLPQACYSAGDNSLQTQYNENSDAPGKGRLPTIFFSGLDGWSPNTKHENSVEGMHWGCRV